MLVLCWSRPTAPDRAPAPTPASTAASAGLSCSAAVAYTPARRGLSCDPRGATSVCRACGIAQEPRRTPPETTGSKAAHGVGSCLPTLPRHDGQHRASMLRWGSEVAWTSLASAASSATLSRSRCRQSSYRRATSCPVGPPQTGSAWPSPQPDPQWYVLPGGGFGV